MHVSHMLASVLLSSAIVTTALASSNWTYGPGWPSPGKQCLTEADAQQLADNFFIIAGGQGIFNCTVAEATLADSFSDSSESVASIADGGGTTPRPLLGPTFANKTAFINANAKQTTTKYEQLNLFHACDFFVVRFQVTTLQPQHPRGISIYETAPAPAGNLYPFQITQVYGEMDSVAWLVDTGYTISPPSRM